MECAVGGCRMLNACVCTIGISEATNSHGLFGKCRSVKMGRTGDIYVPTMNLPGLRYSSAGHIEALFTAEVITPASKRKGCQWRRSTRPRRPHETGKTLKTNGVAVSTAACVTRVKLCLCDRRTHCWCTPQSARANCCGRCGQ
jgi:hypothetical protein